MLFKKNKVIIRERKDHCISRSNIDPDAVKVLYRLANSKFTAYLVGGSVRDMLLGRVPKDFDISTDAQPGQIRKLFRNCFLIGRRFRLAHIVFGKKVIETSTFRAEPKSNNDSDDLYQVEDNTFGTPEQDARRRDFTINGLFYDIKSFAVIDYVGGLKDLDRKIIRCIGNPNVRFREDPVRMMRAIRFASKLDFAIEKSCCRAIQQHHADILNSSLPRICEEVYRLFMVNAAERAFRMMWQFRLLEDLIPEVSDFLDRNGKESASFWKYLAALDSMPNNSEFSNGVRSAVLCYPLFLEKYERALNAAPSNARVNRMVIARDTLHILTQRLGTPKAVAYTAVAVIDLLPRFDKPPVGARSERFVKSVVFPEALLFKQLVCVGKGLEFGAYDEWLKLYESVASHGSVRSSDEAESSTRRRRQRFTHRRRTASR